ncbi:MAG: DUF3810 family protein [Trueperaceae bacterium]
MKLDPDKIEPAKKRPAKKSPATISPVRLGPAKKGPALPAAFYPASVLSLLALALWLLPPAAFEALYVRNLYPALTALSTGLTGWTVLPLGIAVLPPLVGLVLWRTLLTGKVTPLTVRLAGAALLAVVLLACYSLIWGLNYRRPPLPEVLGLAAATHAPSEMTGLAEDMLAWILAYRDSDPNAAEALAAVSEELERLAIRLDRPVRLPAGVKLLPSGSLLRAGYAGMVFPFTLEPQVDAALAPASRVSIGAHELAHVAGFAAESDADLAALLAGLRADNGFARYATALSLLARMLGALPSEERSALIDRLPERAVDDLAEARARSARYFRPTVSSRITAVYDRLLRSQGVSGGVAQYGQAPQLAAIARVQGLLPEPPAR